jgi:hypothetical protein
MLFRMEACVLDPIFARFATRSPISVMAGASLSRLLCSQRLDALFESVRREQYVHKLLFSQVFSLMAAVVTGKRESVHHAYQTAEEPVGVSVASVYNKLKGIEPTTSRALVRDMAEQVSMMIDQMGGGLPPIAPGYKTRVLDGNNIASTEHRLGELREIAAAPLPGKSLVVLDSDRRVLCDIFPCEDGHAQERALLADVLETVTQDELWIADRNFCTTDFLRGIAEKEAYFVIRQHGSMTCEAAGPLVKIGEVETGTVYEQPVLLDTKSGAPLTIKRIELHLKSATRGKDKIIAVLTNLPAIGPRAVDGKKVAQLYRDRWKIESAFQELTQNLDCEIKTLGYPKAALFAFCVAVVIFNAIAMLKAALRGAHGAEKVENEVSDYYIAAELKTTWRGMVVAIPEEEWQIFGKMPQKQFIDAMLMLAQNVKLAHFKKHPRGPKKPKKKPRYDPAHPHVSTAKIIAKRRESKSS